jgi:hypothetical protein
VKFTGSPSSLNHSTAEVVLGPAEPSSMASHRIAGPIRAAGASTHRSLRNHQRWKPGKLRHEADCGRCH